MIERCAMRIFAALLCALALWGCETERSLKKEVLQLWIMPNSPDPAADMLHVLRNFELENPGIEVQVTILDWSVAWTKITTAAATHSGPDVLQMPTTWAASISAMGALMPLDSLLAVSGGDSAFAEVSMKFARPGTSFATSLPWFLDVRPLFFRRDVLAEAGVDPKTLLNWTDFRKALLKIQKADLTIEGMRIAPIGYPGKHDWNVIHNLAPWVWGAGGDFLDSTGSESRLATKESIAGILFYLNLVRDGFNSKKNLTKNTNQVSMDFDEGRLAFWFDVTNKTLYLDSPRFLGGSSKNVTARNYSVMLPPTAPAGKSTYYFAGGSNLSVSRFTKHKRSSMALVRYLSSRPDVQLELSRVTGFLPALLSTYEYPYFKEDETRGVFQQMISRLRSYPAVPYWGEIETEILLRRFGNIFDLITLSGDNAWPEKEILSEIRAADSEINRFIKRQRESGK
ncbi:multiple sugar transport system substrate-binding protein [Fibrobacter intestinalis]|uniref:Multiple sugar transport system substrate-binding protein n=2 Tax=Fibrobacteraceae TaxID=204431 RepID=A0A1M6XKY8_9BACT|nr:multiple sugar transport system substrate-binding protein [Fibrobacter sp. UWS1]SHL06644.1 multiple sugar transport system substrate-binding protein [Fibrobacter intestinalis]